ncbi:hypothetical protein T07_8572 [Trichinella nelsoni]|uniref:Uncharacterized protein n=1 Tax=Trichinella nelsoni TaxID=6336 RepID=A0A0V0RG67_9BILA|nr:hypothetical protein T07_8572 [Trichinella nelsoni]
MVTINQKANVPVNNEKQRKKFHLLRASAVIQLPATCHQAHNNHLFTTITFKKFMSRNLKFYQY